MELNVEHKMTEQEKQLLLKDLCARLPHKQKVCYKIRNNSEEITETLSGCLLDYFKTGKIAVVKPCLRSMSSMTEEEIEDYHNLCKKQWNVHIDDYWYYDTVESIDWLNANHFDYRGLIPKGLAIEAKEGMCLPPIWAFVQTGGR